MTSLPYPASPQPMQVPDGSSPVALLAARMRDVAYPGVQGDPLDPHRPCRLPKPASLIGMRDGGALTAVHRRVLNTLLAMAWRRFAEGRLDTEPVLTVRLRQAVGLEAQTDNRRLVESLERLCTVRVSLALSEQQTDSAPLLACYDIDPIWHELTATFSDAVVPALLRPVPWARIDLVACRKMRSRWALTLYEHLALRARLNHPAWKVDVMDLHALLGIVDPDFPWRRLRHQLEEALQHVEPALGARVHMMPVGRWGRHPPEQIRFAIGTAWQAAGAR
jgi:hypothetical protein